MDIRMLLRWTVCSIILLSYQLVFGAKILVYSPRMGNSHVNFMGKLADALVEDGHNVVFALTAYDKEVKTNGTKLAKIIEWNGYNQAKTMRNITKHFWLESGIFATYKMFSDAIATSINTCNAQLLDHAFIETLRREKFDFGICEVLYQCSYAMFKKIGITNYASALATNPFEWITDGFGVENNPSYVPGFYRKSTDVMNYWERIQNTIEMSSNYVLFSYCIRPFVEMMRSHFPEPLDVYEMSTNSTFLFTNAEELLDFPRLISHKVVYIGGIAVEKPNKLKPEYQKMMDAASGGAILVSFGSIVQSTAMDEKLKETFYRTFENFPKTKFIWKYETDDDNTSVPNVFTSKWLPQNDLLAHKNMRAFISHCGLNSLTETAYASVPVICIGLFGDQLRNSKTAEKRGIGISLDKEVLSTETLTEALNKILNDRSYQKRSMHLAKMIHEKPFPPKERFLKHINFALQFGPINNFDVVGAKLGFIQYYLLDIIIPLIIIIAIIIYIFIRIIIICKCKLQRSFTNKTKSD